MTKLQGSHIWYELMTPDPDGAAAFYAPLLGWTVHPSPQPDRDYRICASAAGGVAGIMAIPGGAPMPPGWFGYVGVDDLDASLGAITAAGGTVHMPVTEIPGVGRIAMVADGQGAIVYVMQPAGSDTPSVAFSPVAVGSCSWNELSTSDQPAALAFYTRLFGWTQGDAMDMGAMGEYRFINHGDTGIGAVMTSPPGVPTTWTHYFRVADIDAAATAVAAHGGQVTHGPSEVPGGDHIVIGTDPQRVTFAIVGKRGAA